MKECFLPVQHQDWTDAQWPGVETQVMLESEEAEEHLYWVQLKNGQVMIARYVNAWAGGQLEGGGVCDPTPAGMQYHGNEWAEIHPFADVVNIMRYGAPKAAR